jgi:hypothetical protein
MNPKTKALSHHLARCAVIIPLVVASALAGAQPQPGRGPERDGGGRHDNGQHRGGNAPPSSGPRAEAGRWYDGAHGNNRHYPRPGWAVAGPPVRSRVVIWGGVNYRYHDSVWYTPGPRGYVVVRPPYGAVIFERPAFFSLLTIGAVAYLYANGVYYREQGGGGYEVVPPPMEGAAPAPQGKTYVYPRQAQSAQQQATDEYECHRWAVSQTGFDPSGAATGQVSSSGPVQRDNYQRATHACLEGRGYTLR